MNDMQSRLADLSPERRALLARRMQAAQGNPASSISEPIAIIGMNCRFPGGATDVDAFWDLLVAGGDAIAEIPPTRWDVDTFYHPNADMPGKITTRWGGFLDGIDQFDADFFGISPREAMHMDPQQRVLLEVVWEALERAGQPVDVLAGSSTGVFMGVSGNDYQLLQYGDGGAVDMYSGTGTAQNIVAGRISYLFDFRGPCVAIDTACSSSLVAVHLACQSLRADECRLALAGGVNIILSSTVTSGISRMHMLAPDGRCKTFDARANGFVRSEGCGVVVLKRLADALKDGDPILALIRGSASNQDGRSASLTAPNGLAQQALLRQALKQAGVEASAIGYIETHGTGTALGDPIEVEALATVYGQPAAGGPACALGALKTNMGHLEAAAGVAGLIKTVLALHHETIPANLHFQALNPHITLEQTRFRIPTENLPWPVTEARRYAGVSSFGWSGTNAHVILEEAPRSSVGQPAQPQPEPQPCIVPLSARSAGALRSLAERYREYLASPCAPPLADLAFSAATRRSHHPHRLALCGSSPLTLRAQLDAFLNGSSLPGLASGIIPPSAPKLAFVFPGQGAQWPGMARQLYREMPTFRAAFEQCAAACRPFLSFSLTDELLTPAQSSAIDVIQPLLFAISVSLSALWQHWGVRPAAVVGHSMGEVAAAYVAGALSLEDAARVICLRSQLLRTVSGQGTMALVELSVTEAEHAIAEVADRVSVAVSNSPRATVLAGEVAALETVLARLEAQQVFCRRIKVDVASHSPQMDPLAPALLKALAPIQPHAGRVPLYSTVRERVLDGHELDAAYWMHNLRQPVQFSTAVAQLVRDGVTLFIELSPHPILLPSIVTGLHERGEAGTTLPSLRREEDEIARMPGTAGALYTLGVGLEWRALAPEGRCVELPSYPWQRECYWVAPSRPAGGRAEPGEAGGQGLLGRRRQVAGQPGLETWEASLGLEWQPYLAEHQVQGRAVMPGAAYLELALAGARELWGEGTHELTEVRFVQMLSLDPDASYTLQLTISGEHPDQRHFEIFSRPAHDPDAGWSQHASGQVQCGQRSPVEPTAIDIEQLRTLSPERTTGASHYQRLEAQQLSYGPAFQGVVELWHRPDEALGQLKQTEAVSAGHAEYVVHPALLDAGLQVLNAAMAQDASTTFLPIGIARLCIFGDPNTAAWSSTRVTTTNAEGTHEGDVLLLDTDGRVLVEVRGMRLQQLTAPQRDPIADWLYTLDWESLELALASSAHAESGSIIIVAERLTAARQLADALNGSGWTCALITAEPAADESSAHHLLTVNPADLRTALQSLTGAGGQPCRNIVVLVEDLPADDAPLTSATQQWARVVALTQALAQAGWRNAPRLWLVTRGTQAVTPDDRVPALSSAPLWGLGRTIAYEHPEFGCTLLDLPTEPLIDEAAILASEVLAQPPDTQIALRPDGRFVARLQRHDPQAYTQARAEQPAGQRPFRLESDRPGTLTALSLRACERAQPGPGQVLIEVAASGLNFIDVLSALGTYPGQQPGQTRFGHECAGTITAIGPGVKGLMVGDAVIACVSGSLATSVVASSAQVFPKPEHLSFVDAAGMPLVFATAYYGLHELARLQPGERVLIHSAAGGVGLAAIQIAHHLGAQVFATAGTPEKRAWLRAQGIAHVYDSRTLAFADQVLADTSGQGVDVVLNSLSGAAIQTSFAALAPYGRFVEIGKKDIYQNAPLALAPFRKSLSYYAVDLLGMQQERPDKFGALLQTVIACIAEGTFRPLPTAVIPIAQVAEAFHTMARGSQRGKLVVSLHERATTRVEAPPAGIVANGTYLITGGLGGLGLSVAQWLVGRGARALVLLGRSSPAPQALATLDQLRAGGASLLLAQADVADPAALAAVLEDIARTLPPLRGIFHAAGVLDDAALLQLDPARFERVAAPKLAGAWHLHRLTRHLALDHFVLFSSGASLLGSPGQANYAAANAFLDALAQHRRAAGLAGLSINWGPWAEVGLAAQAADRGERLAYRGIASMSVAQGLDALGRLIAQPAPQVAVLPLTFRQWRQYYPRVAAGSFFSHIAREQEQPAIEQAHGSSIRDTLLATESGERRTALENYLRDLIASVLRLDPARITSEAPFPALGFNSLMAIEFRNQLELRFSLILPTTLIWAYPTITALATHLAEKIGITLDGDTLELPTPEVLDLRQAEMERLETLSDDEAEALLLAKLESLTKRAWL